VEHADIMTLTLGNNAFFLDKKKAEKRQRHDAWEGSVRGCAMDEV
jgi:hypothetical protein